ncbi:ArsB/NhaD family transporter [Micromonosporaceae bacterium Da 78-11]
MPLIIASLLLIAVLAFAVVRPKGLPEAVMAVPAAAIAVAAGLVPWRDALAELRELGPTVGFLAAVLVLAVFVAAALTTAVLSLDATVVLLTPVVFATAARIGARPRPHVYASAHLANSASLLLPVSNLTNLLAFTASGLTFLGFAAIMTLPWLAVVAVEYLAFRWFFRADLRAPAEPPTGDGDVPAPRYALTVLVLTLVGFAVAQPFGVHPGWVAVAGAVALAVPRRVSVRTVFREATPAFCAFVFALGIVVLAVREHGLGDVVDRLVPTHTGLWQLLAVAGLAALLANVLNNLPATLVLIPAVASSPGLLLAVLIGVNVGPNLTYVGSLATLLWRQILHSRDAAPDAWEFLRLGLLTVPAGLVAAVLALWVGLRLSGT